MFSALPQPALVDRVRLTRPMGYAEALPADLRASTDAQVTASFTLSRTLFPVAGTVHFAARLRARLSDVRRFLLARSR